MQGQLESEISELEDEKQQLKDEGEAERERIRDSMVDIKAVSETHRSYHPGILMRQLPTMISHVPL